MRRSSKIILAVAAVLGVILAAVYIPILSESQPELTQKDAHDLLERLADALVRERTEEVLSFASEDAVIAGRNLKQIREMLRRGFAYAKNLDVTFTDVVYSRVGDTVTLDTQANAVEKPPGASDPIETYYTHPVRFTLQRRAVPHLFGLFTTYQWKIVAVHAPGLPDGGGGF